MSRSEKEIPFKITGNWAIQEARLRNKFPILTDLDLKFTEGKEDELFTRLEKKLNKKREEIILIMKDEETGRL